MATYLERHALINDSDFHKRIFVAMMQAASGLLGSSPTQAQQRWIRAVIGNTVRAPMALIATRILLDGTIDSTSADSALQTKVDGIVPFLVQFESENT